jgi:hypothetical protein
MVYYLHQIYEFIGAKDNFNKFKNNLKLAYYAFKEVVGDDVDIETFIDYIKSK